MWFFVNYCTDSIKINRPGIIYVCTDPFFDSQSFMHNKTFLKKSYRSLNIRKNSEIDDIFLRRHLVVDFQTYFKDSLCLEYLTNFGVKGAKRSIKMCTTNLYNSFLKNILLYMNNWLLKVCSVHTILPRLERPPRLVRPPEYYEPLQQE